MAAEENRFAVQERILQIKRGKILAKFGGCFNKTIIPLGLVGYEMITANSALRTLLAIYHLISNMPS